MLSRVALELSRVILVLSRLVLVLSRVVSCCTRVALCWVVLSRIVSCCYSCSFKDWINKTRVIIVFPSSSFIAKSVS